MSSFSPSPNWSTRSKRTAVVVLLVVFVLLLYLFRGVLAPVIMSVVVAYVLLPIIRFIHERTPLSRGMSIAVVYLFIVAALLAIPITTLPSLVTQGANLLEEMPTYIDQIGAFLSQPFSIGPFTIPLDQYSILDEVFRNLSGNVVSVAQAVGSQSLNVLGGVAGATVSTLGWIVVVLVMSFYMVADRGELFGSVVDLIPAEHRGDLFQLGQEISMSWNAFLRGQLLLCLAIGIVTFILALIIGLPNALILALIAGIAEFVPNLGPIIAAVPAVIIAFVQSDASWLGASTSPLTYAIIVLVIYILIQQVENIYFVPRIIGQSLGLHPLVIFLGAIAGAGIAGILGILLAAPIIATGRLILLYIFRKLSDIPPFPLTQPANPIQNSKSKNKSNKPTAVADPKPKLENKSQTTTTITEETKANT
jgi:predicted PurR-regulated permease PerM